MGTFYISGTRKSTAYFNGPIEIQNSKDCTQYGRKVNMKLRQNTKEQTEKQIVFLRSKILLNNSHLTSRQITYRAYTLFFQN